MKAGTPTDTAKGTVSRRRVEAGEGRSLAGGLSCHRPQLLPLIDG